MTVQQTGYSTRSAFETFVDYQAIKRHLTSKYDYFQYNGKVKASFENFQSRKDVYHFHKLSKKKEKHNMLISNLIVNTNLWIGDIVSDEGYERYLNWKSRIDSLSYHFKIQLNNISYPDDLKKNFIVHSGQHPSLLVDYMQHKISTETFTILCNITKTFPYWEKEIQDTVIAPDFIQKAKKYYPFLYVEDEKKFRDILKIHIGLA